MTHATPPTVSIIPSFAILERDSPSIAQPRIAASTGQSVRTSSVRRGPMRTNSRKSARSPIVKPMMPERASQNHAPRPASNGSHSPEIARHATANSAQARPIRITLSVREPNRLAAAVNANELTVQQQAVPSAASSPRVVPEIIL